MEEEKKETKKPILESVKELNDKAIESIVEQGIQSDNIDYLYKMIDIKKDIVEIEKEENKMKYGEHSGYGNYGEYGNYGNYGEYGDGSYGRRGVKGTGRGRYRGGRGSGNYRGEEMMDEMQYHYGNYSEGREQYNRGNYGAKQDTMKSLDYMMQSVVDFVEMLKQDADSQEEVELIKKYTKQISQM